MLGSQGRDGAGTQDTAATAATIHGPKTNKRWRETRRQPASKTTKTHMTRDLLQAKAHQKGLNAARNGEMVKAAIYQQMTAIIGLQGDQEANLTITEAAQVWSEALEGAVELIQTEMHEIVEYKKI